VFAFSENFINQRKQDNIVYKCLLQVLRVPYKSKISRIEISVTSVLPISATGHWQRYTIRQLLS